MPSMKSTSLVCALLFLLYHVVAFKLNRRVTTTPRKSHGVFELPILHRKCLLSAKSDIKEGANVASEHATRSVIVDIVSKHWFLTSEVKICMSVSSMCSCFHDA